MAKTQERRRVEGGKYRKNKNGTVSLVSRTETPPRGRAQKPVAATPKAKAKPKPAPAKQKPKTKAKAAAPAPAASSDTTNAEN